MKVWPNHENSVAYNSGWNKDREKPKLNWRGYSQRRYCTIPDENRYYDRSHNIRTSWFEQVHYTMCIGGYRCQDEENRTWLLYHQPKHFMSLSLSQFLNISTSPSPSFLCFLHIFSLFVCFMWMFTLKQLEVSHILFSPVSMQFFSYFLTFHSVILNFHLLFSILTVWSAHSHYIILVGLHISWPIFPMI